MPLGTSQERLLPALRMHQPHTALCADRLTSSQSGDLGGVLFELIIGSVNAGEMVQHRYAIVATAMLPKADALEVDLDRDALGKCIRDRDRGNGEILQADACPIEQGDLLRRGAPRMLAVNDGANLDDVGLGDQAPAYSMLSLADADRLRDLVGEDACCGNEFGLDLLLALGVGAHTGKMRPRPHLRHVQDRCKGRGDGDNHIRFGAELIEIGRR